MTRFAITTVSLLLLLGAVGPAAAAVMEDFSASASWDNGATPDANTPPAYQHLIWDSPNVNDTAGTASGGIAGVLMMHSFSGGDAQAQHPSTFAADLNASIDLSSTGVNVGLILGDLYVLFHPGNATGALRVQRLSDSSILLANQNVGFSPSSGSANLHHLSVAVDTVAKQLDITLIDGANPLNSYNKQVNYLAADYVPGTSLLGWRRGSSGQAWYDNFQVVPEPATLILMGAASLGLLRRRRA